MKKKFLTFFFIACMGATSCAHMTPVKDVGEENFTVDLQPTLSMSVGDRKELVLGINFIGEQTGNPEITWGTNDKNKEIIDVTDSKTQTVTVIGLSSGTANVIAYVGKTKSASCRVTVGSGGSGGDTIVSSITLSESTKTFGYDASKTSEENTFTLTAAVITNNGATVNPTWRSSATDVATVSGSGKTATVTALKPGSTNIIASAGGISASCDVTIVDVAEPETITVTLNQTSVSLEENQTLQLVPTVRGGEAASTTWQSDTPSVATVSDNGLVTAVSAGSATITVLVSDGNGNSDTAECFVVVRTQGGGGDQYSWSEPGNIYFHYLRKNHDYDNWAIWAWQTKPKSLEGTLWGANQNIPNLAGVIPTTYGFMTEAECGGTGTNVYRDEYGIIIKVEVSREELPGGKTQKNSPLVTWRTFDTKEQTLGFFIVDQTKMTGETNWESDGGGEIYIEDLKSLMPEGKNSYLHVYCVQGNVANYTTGSGSGQAYVNPTIADTTGQYRSTDDTSLLTKDDYPAGVPTSETFLEDRPGVGYQIFVPSFADSDGDGMGDLRGIINKLDYLQNDVGAKVLWLTPIQKSNSYHGYDVTDYYRIDSKFGTIEEYQELIYKAHQRGMKVLMDMVINHTSKSNVLFQKSQQAITETVNGKTINYRDMYIWKYKGDKVRVWNGTGDNDNAESNFTTATLGGTSAIDKKLNELWYKDGESNYYYVGKFGSGMAELNYNSQATRDYMTDMCKYWLSFGLDGFRLDATKHIYLLGELNTSLNLGSHDIVYDVGFKHYWNEEQQRYIDVDNDYSYDRTLNVIFWKQFAGNLKAAYPNCFLVGENFDGWDQRMAPFYESMDSQFDFQTYFNLNQFYESSIGGKIQSAQTIYKSYRKSGMIDGAFTSNHDIYRLLNHAAQHDEDIPLGVNGKNHKEVNSTNKDYAINMAKYYAAVTIFTPGISWIYYGDELGMSGNLQDSVPMSDGTIYNDHGNNVDRWYRQPMRWGTTKGQDQVVDFTFGGIEILWDTYNQTLPTASQQKSQADSMLNFFKAACDIKNNPSYPTYGSVKAYGSLTGQEKGECYIEISDGVRTVCVCINNTNSAVTYNKMGWSLLGGFGTGYSQSNVPAHGFIVLKQGAQEVTTMKKKLLVLLPLLLLVGCAQSKVASLPVDPVEESKLTYDESGMPILHQDRSGQVTYLMLSKYGRIEVDGTPVAGVDVPEKYYENCFAYEAAVGTDLPVAVSTLENVTFRGWYVYTNKIYPEKVEKVTASATTVYAIFDGPTGGSGGSVVDGYGLIFSDGKKVGGQSLGVDSEGYDQYLVAGYSFTAGQSFSLYDFANQASWAVDLNQWSFGDTDGTGTVWRTYLSKSSASYTVLQDFTADVYIKLKFEADNIYFGLRQED